MCPQLAKVGLTSTKLCASEPKVCYLQGQSCRMPAPVLRLERTVAGRSCKVIAQRAGALPAPMLMLQGYWPGDQVGGIHHEHQENPFAQGCHVLSRSSSIPELLHKPMGRLYHTEAVME